MKRLLCICLLFITVIGLQGQDKLSEPTEPDFNKFALKLSPTHMLLGEVPLIFEYRPHQYFGNEFSFGYVYFNFNLFDRKSLVCDGYKAQYQMRFYFNESSYRYRTWFIAPQVFFKQLWVIDRVYNENNQLFFGGGTDRPTNYVYNEDRQVTGFELMAGFIHKFNYLIIEFYFGAGIRNIYSDRTITKWIIYHEQYVNEYNLQKLNPPGSIVKNTTSPALQIGLNISFPLYRFKKNHNAASDRPPPIKINEP